MVNTFLLVPYLLKDSSISGKIINSEIKYIGLNTYLILYFDGTVKQRSYIRYVLNNEHNIWKIDEQKYIEVWYLIPKDLQQTALHIYCSDLETISQDIILDNVLYWNKKQFVLMCENEKAQAAQKSSLGSFHSFNFII